WVRGHWGIENGLHWVLDVVFREDDSRVREGHAGANLAMLRRVAVSLLKRAPGKRTTPTKRLKAGWDDGYLLQVLQGITGTSCGSPGGWCGRDCPDRQEDDRPAAFECLQDGPRRKSGDFRYTIPKQDIGQRLRG